MKLFPSRRRAGYTLAVLLALALAAGLGYWAWSPGEQINDGRHDQGTNGIWMSHRWLGDDKWFAQNKREHLKDQYRDDAHIQTTLAMLSDKGMTDLFPHLAPTNSRGGLPTVDRAQTERFLDAAEQHGQRVLPWVGGVFEVHCRPADPTWRATFINSITDLLARHPRLAGVHLNIEPWPSGNADCLLLLDELKGALPPDAILSVAAYPPPTRWQPAPEVHWEEDYFREVARRSDHLAIMMYDTSIPLQKPYAALMAKWTQEVLAWSEGTPVLLGLPCYADENVDYHDPKVENLTNALAGVHAGLTDAGLPNHYQGVALYSLWEIDDQEWEIFDHQFALPAP